MNCSEVIRERRSIRKYKENVTIPQEDFERMLEAAMMAPSACNTRSPLASSTFPERKRPVLPYRASRIIKRPIQSLKRLSLMFFKRKTTKFTRNF